MEKLFFFRLTQGIVRRPLLTVLLLFGVAALVGSGARFVHLDNDIRQFFSRDSEEARFLGLHQEVFGPDETTLLVLLEGEGTPEEFLPLVEAVGDALSDLEGVVRVDSAVETSLLHSEGDELLISPAFGSSSLIKGTFEERLKIFRSASFGGGRLLSEDGTTAMVLVELAAKYGDVKYLGEPIVRTQEIVAEVVARRKVPVRVSFGGVPFTRHGAISSMVGDMLRLFPITILIIACLLFWMFRRRHAVALPMMAIVLSAVCTLGVVGFLGMNLNPLTLIFPILLMVIAVADGVHFLSRYHEERSRGLPYEEAASIAGARVGTACLLTSFTTAVGFASLLLTEMTILRSFGLVVTIGVCFAFTIVVTLIPAGLALSKSPPSRPGKLIAPGLEALVRWCLKGRRPLGFVALGGCLVVGSLCLTTRVQVDNFLTHALPEDHPVTRGNHRIEEVMTGIVPVEFSFVGEAGDFRKPVNLARLEEVMTFVRERGVQGVTGLPVLLRELHQKLGGSEGLPESSAAVAQLLLLIEDSPDSGLWRLVSDDYSHARIFGTNKDGGSRAFLIIKEEFDAFLKKTFLGTGIKASVTGVATVASIAFLGLVNQLLGSLLVALVVIMFSIGVIFRSAKMALAGLLSNTLPLLLGLAWYGIGDTYLNPAPAVVFSIALGIAVDDTIHVLARYREELTRQRSHHEAIVAAMTHSLGAIVITSVILVAGFLVIGYSAFPQNQQFGVLGAVIIFLALVADLFFTPASLMLLKPGEVSGEREAP